MYISLNKHCWNYIVKMLTALRVCRKLRWSVKYSENGAFRLKHSKQDSLKLNLKIVDAYTAPQECVCLCVCLANMFISGSAPPALQ